MFATWTNLVMLGFEAQQVIWLRMMTLAGGGPTAGLEAHRMVTEKMVAAAVASGQIMTGALLGAAPPLIIYAFLMDYYIAGLTAGATKG